MKFFGVRILSLVFAGYWVLAWIVTTGLYLTVPFLNTTGAVMSASIDTVSLISIWVVAWGTAAYLPVNGRHALRNLGITATIAVSFLLVRILALRPALRGYGWFAPDTSLDAIVIMLPGNILTFIVFWMGGWAMIHYHRGAATEMSNALLRLHVVRSRLDALMSRLQPHFVGNALNAVSALVHDAPSAARGVLNQLREVIRDAIDQPERREVMLSAELDFMKRFLAIQQTRFADRLRVDVRTEPDTESAWVPRLVLQPLVENVVKHAVDARLDPVRLQIVAVARNGSLILSVLDDGPGILTAGSGGLGLRNTRERLAVLYGDRAELTVESRSSGGTVACVRIPLLREPVLEPVETGHTVGVPVRGSQHPRARFDLSAAMAQPRVVVAVCIAAILTMTASLQLQNPAAWPEAMRALPISVLRVGAIMLPAAVALRLPERFPLAGRPAVSIACAMAVLAAAVVGAQLINIVGVSGIVGSREALTRSRLLTLSLNGWLVFLNVLAAAYVAQRVALQGRHVRALADQEADATARHREGLASLLDADAVYQAFDRIEAAIGVDTDAANAELSRLSRHLSTSIRGAV